jgi:hypothetical protein
MIKPKSVEIYPVYICSECGCRHCETIDYVKKIGKILCACGQVMELAPLETFNVTPVFKYSKRKIGATKKTVDTETKNKENNVYKIIEKNIYDEAVELLVSLGCKKKEAKTRVDNSLKEWIKSNYGVSIQRENFDEFANTLIFNF